MYTSGICFYDIEEDVEMHITKKKENKKDGYTKTESYDQSLHFFTMNSLGN